MHYHLFTTLRRRYHLFFLRLFNNIHIMFFKANSHRPILLRLIICIRHSCNLVMSNELIKIFIVQLELMIIQPGFIRNLMRYKLSMMSSWNGFINNFFLIFVFNQVGINKLCHFDVVSKEVNWYLYAFSYGDELFF